MTTSSMFLADTTNIDFAYVDDFGRVIGGSFRPKFHVAGQVSEDENVVVDFSAVKKLLKGAIDDKQNGFDHKLWWIHGVSKGTITHAVDESSGESTVTIDTPLVNITGPSNIVKEVADANIAGSIKEYLLAELDEAYPEVQAELDVWLTSDMDGMPDINTMKVPFRYVHGLRESSSWGCQNIAHGHLSFIAAVSKYPDSTNLVLTQIAAELDTMIFAWSENVVDQSDDSTTIEYVSARGRMRMCTKQDKVMVLETETTVEHLINAIIGLYGNQLRRSGAVTLYVSEGLSKGAVVTL